jgi:hypothetical protein
MIGTIASANIGTTPPRWSATNRDHMTVSAPSRFSLQQRDAKILRFGFVAQELRLKM